MPKEKRCHFLLSTALSFQWKCKTIGLPTLVISTQSMGKGRFLSLVKTLFIFTAMKQ